MPVFSGGFNGSKSILSLDTKLKQQKSGRKRSKVMNSPPCPSSGTIIHTIHLYIQLPFDSVSCISALHVGACFNLCHFCNMLDDSGAMHLSSHPAWCIVHCININRMSQIRTVILIQSVSRLRFLLFMQKYCVCGTFAPSGLKRKPGQVVSLVGFLPLRGLCGPRNR